MPVDEEGADLAADIAAAKGRVEVVSVLEQLTIAEFGHESLPPGRDALVVNYSAVSDSAWEGTLGTL